MPYMHVVILGMVCGSLALVAIIIVYVAFRAGMY